MIIRHLQRLCKMCKINSPLRILKIEYYRNKCQFNENRPKFERFSFLKRKTKLKNKKTTRKQKTKIKNKSKTQCKQRKQV